MTEPWNSDRLTSAACAALCSSSLLQRAGPLRPEHVFCAIADLRTSVASATLRSLGLRWSDLGVPELRPEAGEPVSQLSVLTRELFERASDEALELGHHPINTGHLVLAILREDAGPLPSGSSLSHGSFSSALKAVLARPWVHGYALDGEFVFYLTRDETLVLFSTLLRRFHRKHALDDAERVVVGGVLDLMKPVCGALLDRGLDQLERARRAVVRKARGRAQLDGGSA